ncbi:hypothetical protein ACVWXS_003722 [Lysinibacillus sp. TE18511]
MSCIKLIFVPTGRLLGDQRLIGRPQSERKSTTRYCD